MLLLLYGFEYLSTDLCFNMIQLFFFFVDGEMKLEFVFVSKAKVNAGQRCWTFLCACVSGLAEVGVSTVMN